jgi:AcrR family transcriptional regulator
MASDTASVIALALDSSVQPPDDALSTRVLDAALDQAAAVGVRNLTMDDVARRARVGRMTLYRRFGGKDQLVEALAVRESRRCLAELDAAVRPDDPVQEQVAQGFVTSVRLAHDHPMLNRLARLEPESVLEALSDEGIFAAARTFVALRLQESVEAGVLEPVAVDELAEVLVRLAMSFVLIQQSVLPLDDEEAARDAARALIAPLVAAHLAR